MLLKFLSIVIVSQIVFGCYVFAGNGIVSNKPESNNAIYSKGVAYFKTNRLGEANSYLIKAKANFAAKSDYRMMAECLYYLSSVAVKENRYDDAKKSLNEAMEFITKFNLHFPLLMETYYLQGNILLHERKIEETYNLYKQLEGELKKQNWPDTTLARMYYIKGSVEYYKGDYFGALNSFEEATSSGKKAYGEKSLFVSNQINNLGVINYMLARYDEALAFYRESEQLLDINKTADRIGLAGTYTNIGLVFKDKGDHYNALIFFNKACDLYLNEKKEGQSYLANIFINLAMAYSRLNNKEKQMDNLNLAHKFCKIYNQYLLPKVYFQYAVYYENEKQLKKAQENFVKAIHVSKEIFGDSPDLANAHSNYGEFLISSNIDVKEAIVYFEKARDFFINSVGYKSVSVASSYNHIGNYYEKTGDLRKALENFHMALLCLSDDFSNKSTFSFSGNYKTLSESLSIEVLKAKARIFTELSAETNDNKLKLTYLQSAFYHYKKAIKFIERVHENYFIEESRFILSESELSTFGKAIGLGHNLYKLTGSENFKDDAFVFADIVHAASLQTMVRQKNEQNKNGINNPLLKREFELKKELSAYNEWINREKGRVKPDSVRIAFWNSKVAETTFKLEELIQKINKDHPTYRYLSNMSGKLHRIKDIQNKLGTKESIIEYFLTDSVLYSFCLTSDEYELNREVITGTFFGDIEKVLNFVKYPTITASDSLICLNYRNASYNLYTKLILPFLPIIKDKSLIIVPDGRLTYLPFSTLLTCSTLGESLNYKELPYLLKQYPIRYVYASGLINTMNNNHAKKLMLAFAPSYENSEGKLYLGLNSLRDGDLNYLNFNKKEVETAANYIGGSVLYSKGASEETFKKKAGDYRIVHLAMHATANDDDPVNSRLYFTPNSSTSDDDFLYSYETYNLKLNTDLLVLSACNSGTGKLQKGEGILSLTRGFVFAGVKSIIMTLWAVDDKAAYSINERFYKNITRKLPKDEALQKSSLEYIQTSDIIHAHPYYWAGYVLIGDNSAIDCFRIRLGYMLAFILFVVIASVSFIYYTSYKQKLKKQRLG